MTRENHAREKIDQLLTQAGWLVQDVKHTNIFAGKGVAIREFPLKSGQISCCYRSKTIGSLAGLYRPSHTLALIKIMPFLLVTPYVSWM